MEHPAGHPADHPGPLVFVDDVNAPTLADDDRHHLERVLRLRVGDPLTIGDGRGRWRTGILAGEVEPDGPVHDAPASEPSLTIGFALVKGDKPELIVQKLTELGIDRIVPVRAERSVVRWDDVKASKAVMRLRAVARSASMQCHRPHLPVVDELTELASIAREPGAVFAQRGGAPITVRHQTVLIGPEGGWSPDERQQAAETVTLGGHVLRAETAAIVAGALMAALRSGHLGRMT